MAKVSQVMAVAEAVKEMAGPASSGAYYVSEKTLVVSLTAGAQNAFAFAVQNQEPVDCLITRVVLDITTAGGTASAVIDIDTVDGATDTGDDIIDGLDINQTGTFDSITNKGTNGDGTPVRWGKKGSSTDYLTGKILAAAASSLVGKVLVKYVPLS